MKTIKKRLVSMMTGVVLCLSLFPWNSMAADLPAVQTLSMTQSQTTQPLTASTTDVDLSTSTGTGGSGAGYEWTKGTAESGGTYTPYTLTLTNANLGTVTLPKIAFDLTIKVKGDCTIANLTYTGSTSVDAKITVENQPDTTGTLTIEEKKQVGGNVEGITVRTTVAILTTSFGQGFSAGTGSYIIIEDGAALTLNTLSVLQNLTMGNNAKLIIQERASFNSNPTFTISPTATIELRGTTDTWGVLYVENCSNVFGALQYFLPSGYSFEGNPGNNNGHYTLYKDGVIATGSVTLTHNHSWTYESVSGKTDTLKATCQLSTCVSATAKVVAPTDTICNGTAKPATIAVTDIAWQDTGNKSALLNVMAKDFVDLPEYDTVEDGVPSGTTTTTAPSEAGTYRAIICGSNTTDSSKTVSAYVEYTLTALDVTWPTIRDIYVNDTLTDAYLNGGIASVKGDFTITNAVRTWDTAGMQSVTVTFRPKDTALEPIISAVTVNVRKRTIASVTTDYTDDITGECVMTDFDDLGLPDKVDIVTEDRKKFSNVPVIWRGYDETSVTTQTLTGTLDLSEIGNEVQQSAPETKLTATVTLKQVAAAEVTAWPTIRDIYVNDTLTDASLNGGIANVKGVFTITADNRTWTTAGTQSVTVTFQPKNPDLESLSSDVTVIVRKRTIANVTTSYTDKIDNQYLMTSLDKLGLPDKVSIVTEDGKKFQNVPVTWRGYNDVTVEKQTLTGTLDLSGISNEVQQSAPETKLTATVTLKLWDKNVNAENQSAVYTGDEIEYKFEKLKETFEEDPNYQSYNVIIWYEGTDGTVYQKSTTPPTNVGTYIVTLTFEDKPTPQSRTRLALMSTSTPPADISAKLVITQKDIADATITARSFPCTGNPQTLTLSDITVTLDGKTLIGNTDYTISGSLTQTAAGSYDFTVTGTGNYTGSVTKQWEIRAASTTPTVPNPTDTPDDGELEYYTIRATAYTGGTITPHGVVHVAAGDNQSFTIKPYEGYAIADVRVDGKSIGKVDRYTFQNVIQKHTITVYFARVSGFSDVPADSYCYDAVNWAISNGITNGMEDDRFVPDGVCSRAQAVTFLWRASGCPTPETQTMPFTDVAADSYYYDAVLWAAENGITVGISETTFAPNENCTRAHIITFLWRMWNKPFVSCEIPFTDVQSEDYYYTAVVWAYLRDITHGTMSATFSPHDDCTRSQMVTFLYRAMQEA